MSIEAPPKASKGDNAIEAGESGMNGASGLTGANVTLSSNGLLPTSGNHITIHAYGGEGGDGGHGMRGIKGQDGAHGKDGNNISFINDPLGQIHSLARSNHYSHYKFVLFCEILKSGDRWM